MIDEEKLIDELLNNYLVKNNGTWNDAIDRALELTKSSQKLNEWIPVSERLPEGCKEAELEVLISTKEIYPDAYFNEAGFALYYPETKTFHSVYGDRLDITEIVIAWQYLPEPFSADREKVTE